MPTYGKENFKESNVNYLNKDFSSLKESLMNYAKSYFPNTYRDFNETSPGMMLLEMNAYVGDVLSFYIDQQYQEMLLPLAEERRNIITMAKMFGYKVKPIIPAYVDLTFTSEVNALSTDRSKVDYDDGGIFDPGMEILASSNSNIIFSTLDYVDFQIEHEGDTDTIGTTLDSGLVDTYTLSRSVKAISATEKTISFQIGVPEKFKTLTIPDTNVIDIISCVDSNGNNWYEVDFLAQDKVPIPLHYTNDEERDSAMVTQNGGLESSIAVPYALTYITTPKRFTRETNQDNTTSLVFGNGILNNGQLIDQGFLDLEQVGIIIPGQTNDLNQSIDPLLGDEYSTLGQTPNNTTLTITYRVGGGVDSNVSANDLTTLPTSPTIGGGNTSAELTSVTNLISAVGGKDEEDTIEIKEKAKSFFTTQNRCVTKEDYEARVLNIPSKFGNIAKAYVTRRAPTIEGDVSLTQVSNYINQSANFYNDLTSRFFENNNIGSPSQMLEFFFNQNDISSLLNYMLQPFFDNTNLSTPPSVSDLARELELGTINIYALAYNNSKQLVGRPETVDSELNDKLPDILVNNILNYLENFKILTDVVTINDGYIVNFGVFFDIIAEKYADKQKVKLDCIQKIKDYFRIEKMQFNQPIYKSNLEFELMGVEGVRSIGHVTITQERDYFYTQESGEGESFSPVLFSYQKASGLETYELVGDGGFGFKYDFENSLSTDGTIILPPSISTPAVFELKNPNQNIKGRVR